MLHAKQKGDLIIRLRSATLTSDTHGTNTSGGSARVGSDTVPELDFTYFFTDNIAAELILATTKNSVDVAGVAHLGEVSLLPPVLTLQYHFQPKAKFSPYVGAGLNYTMFYDVKKSSAITAVKYEDSFGLAFQVGMDIAINDRWSFNVDLKKIYVSTDITVNNGSITTTDTDLDPWVFGVGFGYKY